MNSNTGIKYLREKFLRGAAFALIFILGALFSISGSARTYIVCVGLNVYDNGENPLPCSRGDARGMANFFNRHKDTDVFMLLDSNATRSHILKVLKSQFAKAGPNDEIIFAYSGHGFDGGVTCYDTKNVVWCTEVQDIMRGSNAGRKVIFMNACHSGSFSKRNPNNNGKGNFRTNKADVMLFLSSRANESSWERSDMTYSFFFNNLLKGLSGKADANGDRKVTAREIFNYVYAGVISDTGGKQHPQMYGKFSDDMVIVEL